MKKTKKIQDEFCEVKIFHVINHHNQLPHKIGTCKQCDSIRKTFKTRRKRQYDLQATYGAFSK